MSEVRPRSLKNAKGVYGFMCLRNLSAGYCSFGLEGSGFSAFEFVGVHLDAKDPRPFHT